MGLLNEWQMWRSAVEGRTGIQVAIWQTEKRPVFNRFLGRDEWTSVDRVVVYVYRDHDSRWLNVITLDNGAALD